MEKSLFRRLDELLPQVYTSSGDVKNCGRDSCTDLILAAERAYPRINFGNPDTGMMYVSVFREHFFPNR